MATEKPTYTPDITLDLSAFDNAAVRHLFRTAGWHRFDIFLRAFAVAVSCSGPEARAEIERLNILDLQCAWNDYEKKNSPLH